MLPADISACCILIVDDEQRIVDLLQDILKSNGYQNSICTTDSRQACELFRAHKPDLVILDLHMPQLGGVEILGELRTISTNTYLPIVVLTGDLTSEAKRRALRAGATDFLVKPFDSTEVLLRMENLLLARVLHKQLKLHNDMLEHRVKERTRQLAEAQVEILNQLSIVSEYQDDDTGLHTQRIGALAALVARELGQTNEEVELIRLAAPLHDVGKVGVPNHILLKSGNLMPSEFEIMRSHTTVGGEIFAKSKFPLFQLARQIALYHHERWDGMGYPQRLKGEQIPVAPRIVAVVDAFDALTQGRPYKKAVSFQAAVSEIKAQSGSQFDPHIVDVFMRCMTARVFEDIKSGLETIHESSIEALATVCGAGVERQRREEAVPASQA